MVFWFWAARSAAGLATRRDMLKVCEEEGRIDVEKEV